MLRPLATAAIALCSALAYAQGPDVIVGDIPETANYTSGGAIGGIRSYAIGTTSCNLGTTELTWIAETNQHPVISQNMYRLANGRFEQIGQAWLKHGFCALQGQVCSSGCSPSPLGCDALGVLCSDPYSASLNGSQGGLGPKAEVNAATGFFPYPWQNNGTGSGALFKRLQVAEADLTTAGGLYFVSSMYVQPEDAAAGNDNNNESYRRVTIGAAPAMNLSLQGTTARGSPAIFAWRDHGGGVGVPDAGVLLVAVDVPSDGRFWVGSKATDLGGGQWHYEYAIQNLNSHRSGQSFSIPLPAGAVVTNVGFKDVAYHSGEPFAGTDWTSSVTASSVTWSTQTFAQNQNANALRWDTIYNFRFQCNIPPAGEAATLGLFRTGTPASVTAGVVAPSSDGQSHPANDDCFLATAIVDGTYAFNTAGATTDGPAEPGGCVISGYNQIGADIWYSYVAECAGAVDVRTCGSTFDTKIAVYNGPACPTAASQIACSDDSNTCGTNSLQSQLTFTAVAGNTYLIRVGGFNALTGTGTLTVADAGCGPQAPANDACVNAPWVAAGVLVTGTTTNATNDGTASCGSSSTSADVWYKYRPLTTGTVGVNTCGSGYDTVLSIHSACGGTQLACNDDNANGGNNACGGGLSSGLNISMTAGVTYWIRIAGYQGLTGNFNLLVTGGGGVIPPSNDNCSDRAGIALGATPFSTVGATTDGIAHALCNQNGSNAITNDVWYNHPSLSTGNLVISTCGTATFNTRIAVYSDAGCTNLDARLLACNDNACSTQAEVTIPVVSGQNYTIRVGGTSGATGSGSLVLSMATNTPPSITQQPTNAAACVGGSASFTIVATGTAPLSYQWRRGTTNLVNGGNISGATSVTLTINPVGTGDAASNYNCVVTNVAGSATSNSVSLTVNTPPSITTNPTNQTACAGGSVTLGVAATGTAPLSYQWRRGTTNLVNGGSISGATSASLTINPVGAGDAASNYNCVVTNLCGSATTTNATVTVNIAPSIGTQPVNQSVTTGDSASFTVAATGTAPLTYQWRRGTTNLVNGGSISGATSTTLTIDPAAEGDEAADYNCVVTNSCGSATSNNASLTVNPAPCAGDFNGDGVVDLGDLAIILSNFGTQSGATPSMGDSDGDGDIEIDDLADLLSRFGTTCP